MRLFVLATLSRCARRSMIPNNIPNGPIPVAIGNCLEYTVYHGPRAFIQTLLENGATPNPRITLDFRSTWYQRLHAAAHSSERAKCACNCSATQNGADPRLRTRIDDCETLRNGEEGGPSRNCGDACRGAKPLKK